jgi:hypothetical protein
MDHVLWIGGPPGVGTTNAIWLLRARRALTSRLERVLTRLIADEAQRFGIATLDTTDDLYGAVEGHFRDVLARGPRARSVEARRTSNRRLHAVNAG